MTGGPSRYVSALMRPRRTYPVGPWPETTLEERRVSIYSASGVTRGRAALGVLAASALLLVSACGGNTATTAPAASDGGAAASNAPSGDGPSIFVIGGKPDDPFWSKVKRGADDAGLVVKAQGGSVTWLGPQNYDNLGPDAAKLVQTALAQNPDGVVGPDWVPDAQDAAFKQVVDAGIPLFLYNAGGVEAADKLGALNYVGTDEIVAGNAGGRFIADSGLKHALCVNTFPGASFSEARCKGIAEGMAAKGGTSSVLPLPSSNYGDPTAVSQAIKAALLKDSTIDAIVTLGTLDVTSAVSAVEQAGVGDRVKVGTFDMDETTLLSIKEGKILFAIDQQPYLQGFIAVSMLSSYIQWGLSLEATRPVLTGPALINSANADLAIAGTKAGTR